MSKLHFRYAAMSAGKSTALLQIAHNYVQQGRDVLAFTWAGDNRCGQGRITTRLGISSAAQTFDSNQSFSHLDLEGISCVLIDEAQFLRPVQVFQLHKLASLGAVPVICFGLRTDFLGNVFEGSAALLSLADEIEELRTICACGRKATMNIRLGSDGSRVTTGPQLMIGGDQHYRSVCGACFYA